MRISGVPGSKVKRKVENVPPHHLVYLVAVGADCDISQACGRGVVIRHYIRDGEQLQENASACELGNTSIRQLRCSSWD